MTIFRLNLWKRYREWREVIEEEERNIGFTGWLHMAWVALRIPFVRRAEWRRKMRICRGCPVYDRTMKRCRPFTGSDYGCGCYVPLLAMGAKECWGDQNFPGSVGWNKKTVD